MNGFKQQCHKQNRIATAFPRLLVLFDVSDRGSSGQTCDQVKRDMCIGIVSPRLAPKIQTPNIYLLGYLALSPPKIQASISLSFSPLFSSFGKQDLLTCSGRFALQVWNVANLPAVKDGNRAVVGTNEFVEWVMM